MTQFEAETATAFVALADAGVEFAVIEAGLGGRLDATNVLPSKRTVLTSIGLEHTEWLGDTVVEIAAEKLAVLRDHTTLVPGPAGRGRGERARTTAARASQCRFVAADEHRAPAIELGRAGAVPAPKLRRRPRGGRDGGRRARSRAGPRSGRRARAPRPAGDGWTPTRR